MWVGVDLSIGVHARTQKKTKNKKKKQKKNVYFKEDRPHAQNTLIVLSSIINMIGGPR
jgi:hypothetical protein